MKTKKQAQTEIDQLTDSLQEKAEALLAKVTKIEYTSDPLPELFHAVNSQFLGEIQNTFLYILDDEHTPVLARNVFHWAEFMESAKRVIVQTHMDDSVISTVFLGVDDGSMLLFETARLTAGSYELLEKYQTWEEAETGHALHVERITALRLEGSTSPKTAPSSDSAQG